MKTRFDRARIAIHRRISVPADRPLFHYDIDGWVPGDQAIVPAVGDLLHLPGMPTVKVVQRAFAYPHPGSAAFTEGCLNIDLVVEAAEGPFGDEAPAADPSTEPPADPAEAAPEQLADLYQEMI